VHDIAVSPHDVWRTWNLQPSLILALAVAGLAYWRGVDTLWRPGGTVRTVARGVPPWRVAAFGGGLFALVIALLSPLDPMSEELLSAHMVQHLLLMVVAAPLLVLGSPALVIGQAVPTAWRRRAHRWGRTRPLRAIGRLFTHPLMTWFLATAVLWGWHVPSLYQAALERPTVHVLEHAAFLATAMLFWWTALQPSGPRRLPRGADVVFVFTGALQSGALGALLAFASQPIYPFYVHRTIAWGLSPLQDQQLAGMLMWVPPFVIYLVAAGALFVRWLRVAELDQRRADARADRLLAEGHHR